MRFGVLPAILGSIGGLLMAAGPDVAPAALTPKPATGPRLGSPYQPYRIRLSGLVNPPSTVIGLLVHARIDGGPSLRLLVDSGAEHLVVSSRAARRSGHQEGGEELDLVGAGASARTARLTSVAVLELGGLKLLDCPMVIVDGPVLAGVDGVIPLAYFGAFLVHFDVGTRALDLEPFPEDAATADPAFVPIRAHQNLLFLQTRLEGEHDGFLLLDTGSSFNVISNRLAAQLKQSLSLADSLSIQAGGGQADGRLLPCRVSFRFGERTFALDPVVAVDLASISQRHRLDIAGVMGFPALAGSVMTVNYRDSRVRIQPSK